MPSQVRHFAARRPQPLVLLCGLPASGKTTRARQLADHLAVIHPDRRLAVVGDPPDAGAKTAIYTNPAAEKVSRADQKSEVEQHLGASASAVVILDSLNYIKGYRYELYCSVKHLRHTQCLIFCDASPETARDWNAGRCAAERYPVELFDQLCARFEPPSPANRWDSPLVLVPNSEPLPCAAVCQALFDRPPDKQNRSTMSRPLAAPDFLHDLDQATRVVMQHMMAAQAAALPGDQLAVPGCQRRLAFTRHLSLGELQRARKQFLTGLRSRPSAAGEAGVAGVTDLFVEYLNSTL